MLSLQFFELSTPTATILGALVGATAVILTTIVTTLWQHRTEQKRILETRNLERSREETSRVDVISTEVAGAVRQLAIKMSTALHSMCWLTWLARSAPDQVTKAKLDLYDSEQHKTLPEIGGYSTTVAALDQNVYKKFNRLSGKSML